MTYGNKEYQVIAIEQLVKSISELLAKDAGNKVCVFQSPTGSGKTVMVAKFIEEIVNNLTEFKVPMEKRTFIKSIQDVYYFKKDAVTSFLLVCS